MSELRTEGDEAETGHRQPEFEELWRRHSATVLRYAARRVPAGDVDDVVAETFLVAWRRSS